MKKENISREYHLGTNAYCSKKRNMGKYKNVIGYVFILGIGMGSLVLFFYLHYTPEIMEYINKVNASNTTMGFRLTIIYGFAKLISLILGISIPVAVIFKSIKEGKKRKNAL
ncbi:hypothetical protein [Aquiflexum gelatinilyticum]|jgi:hypothetical protein|uniref:Uncharacterized protein n=1 Tax=Aquiflexum gelatinilyticum TaxID=2961943 RepID=A0A9X2T070_9BACT|nr:hypothetical protein [Aquiflexum gelatinilyticum]MCR9013505.1 hypothetical protein [Aquiflexum gelatinilyticum]